MTHISHPKIGLLRNYFARFGAQKELILAAKRAFRAEPITRLVNFEFTLAKLVMKKLRQSFVCLKNQPQGEIARSKWVFVVDWPPVW